LPPCSATIIEPATAIDRHRRPDADFPARPEYPLQNGDAMRIRQVLADMRNCNALMEDEDALREAAIAAAFAAGATVIGEHTQRYVPHGVTFVLFLAESHIMLTTWPEYRLVMADILLCNPEMSEDAAIDEIARRVCPDGVVERSYVTRHIEPLGTA
jgi:S-adenosylmethionine decarboxylase